MTGEGAFKLSGDRYGRFGEQTGRHSGGPFFVWIGGAAMPRPRPIPQSSEAWGLAFPIGAPFSLPQGLLDPLRLLSHHAAPVHEPARSSP